MKWMIKCLAFLNLCDLCLMSGFSSPCQLGDVLHLVDVCSHLGVYYLVLCVCDAGEGIDCQRCVYSMCIPVAWMCIY
jgi:hypothetical protein